MTDPSTAEAITALAPLTRPITAGGKEYTAKPLETRQIFPILRSILPIIDGLAAMVPKDSSVAGGPTLGAGPGATAQAADVSLPGLTNVLGSDFTSAIRTMAAHGERIVEMVACALDLKVSEVGKWPPLDTFTAARRIVEVNTDFFTREVLPLLGETGLGDTQLGGAIKDAWQQASLGAGATPSSS